MNSIKLYEQLINEGIVGTKGKAVFRLHGLESPVKDKSVFGNLIQEWLRVFMEKHSFNARIQDNSQEFPDFFMHPTSDIEDLLEVKCFTKSPNFDIANFQAYARSLLNNAYRLDANYLIFEYEIISDEITIKHIWIKKVWEIASASERSALKIQWKQGIPVNVRPATWYSTNTKYPVFSSRKEFVSALKKVIDTSPQCENIRKDWFKNVCLKYKEQTGKDL